MVMEVGADETRPRARREGIGQQWYERQFDSRMCDLDQRPERGCAGWGLYVVVEDN